MDPYLSALFGGALIGVAASILLLLDGRIAGVAGTLGGLVTGEADTPLRVAFLGGLVVGGAALAAVSPASFGASTAPSWVVLGLAGAAVGAGTRLGGGCTSGHGVCGLSRGSPRSLVAVMTFMATGGLVVLLLRAAGVS